MTAATGPAGFQEAALPWSDACHVARLFAFAPTGKAVILRAPPGPARDAWLAILRQSLPANAPLRRIPPTIQDARLLGGLDLAATLATGRRVAERGVLADADGGVLVLAMAERLPPETAARIARALDCGEVRAERDGLALRQPARFGLVALDEGIGEGERPPAALIERASFWLDLSCLGPRDLVPSEPASLDSGIEPAGEDAIIAAICETALVLGIASARAPIQALAAARALAAMERRDALSAQDIALACRLVLAPRATQSPAPPDPSPEQASERPADSGGSGRTDEAGPLAEIVLEACRAMLPPGVLASLRTQAPRSGLSGRSGQVRRGFGHGRAAGVRPGDPRGGARLHVLETLRAAAPWQRLRLLPPRGLAFRREDFRIIRTERRTQTTTIFLVDASGSAALHRLAEAKGAVELLLRDSYARRDWVALLAFRGTGVELLLPPTHSLARARRSLAALPGGGGTPLAAGLEAAHALAESVRRKGQTPSLVLLTDGRANVARDGRPGRAAAEADATAAARRLRASGIATLLVDTAPRPSPAARAIAAELGAAWLPLPHAEAEAISQAAARARQP